MAKNGPDPAGSPARRPATPSRARTVGPVPELEQHLPPEWWRTLFNAVYLKTDGDVVENDALTRSEIDAILAVTGAGKNDRILDLCCGQGRHTLELSRRGFTNVTGLDRSRYLIRLARRRARKEALSAAFREGDARRRRFSDNAFDYVHLLGNSFGYFDQSEDDATVLANVLRYLRPGGTLVLDIADGAWLRDHFEPRSWEWIDQFQFVCRERSLSGDESRLVSREVVVDSEKGVIADQFYAERLYTRDSIRTLLERQGFENVRLHGETATESSRGQDLGMMARRLLVTATCAKKPDVPRRSRVPFPEVTVLLGDPRLPDAVKLGGVFNEEDLDTVTRLKTALAGLSDYRFTYLDNHESMLQELRRTPPAFVFNLCDEGFGNAADRELHVPAYLELMGIPYTGSAPPCLGLCFDKGLVSAIARSVDVPVPLETYVAPDDLGGTIPAVFPALIKPVVGDGSIGITDEAVVHAPEEAVRYLNELRETLPGTGVLVQEFLAGAEYSVSIIGNLGLEHTVLPILEVDYGALPAELPKIVSYDSKWQPESPYWQKIQFRETEAPEDVQRALIDHATRLFGRLGCRDYARFDFRMDAAGVPKLLDVNPNPGWCWDGKLNLMAEMAGHSYGELLRLILAAAQQRVATTAAPRKVKESAGAQPR